MSREKEELQGVTLLGNQKTKYPQDYAPEMLETFINKHQDHDYFVKFNCPEFTSLCPMTGQPDFATIYISYVPDVKMVESKSLKLYLFSFRNHGDFHEDCVNIIMKDLIKLMRKNRFCEDELLHVGKDLLDLALVGLVELAEGLAGQADIVEALSLQRVLADLLPVRHAVDLVIEEVVDVRLDVVLRSAGSLDVASEAGILQSAARESFTN